MRTLKLLNSPHEILVVKLGETADLGMQAHLALPAGIDLKAGVEAVLELLREKKVTLEYHI